MPGDFGIVYPLWNHTDGGESLLERVIGEVGIEHVTIPVVTGPLSQFCLFGPRDTPYFHTDGGWHYPADAKAYAASGVKPRAAKWCGQRDVLNKVGNVAHAYGLQQTALIDVEGLGCLADGNESAQPRDAWGSTRHTPRLCPSSPVFRAALRDVLAELRTRGISGFQLRGLCLDLLETPTEAPPLWLWVGGLSNVCFCPACREIAAAADVDPDQAARSLRVHCEQGARHRVPSTGMSAMTHVLRADETLRTYVLSRISSLRDWVNGLPMADRLDESFFLEASIDSSSQHNPLHWKLDRWRVVRTLPSFAALPTLHCSLGEKQGEMQQMISAEFQHRSDAACILLQPRYENADALVKEVSGAAGQGVKRIDFQNLEQMPPETVDWVRQAVRYARRG